MPTKARLGLVILLFAGALAAGLWWWRQSQQQSAPADRLVLYGNVDIRQVDLAFNGSERITRMLVQEGDRVEQGQLLATLATGRLQARLAQAEAQAAAQRQALAKLEAGTRIEEINQVRAEVEVAQAQVKDTRRSLQRVQDLARRSVASQQQLDDAEAAADAAAARLKAAKAALALAVAGPRQEDIAAAGAMLKAAEAALALAREELKDASLFAPSTGVIRNRILEPGDMASPQKPVYTLALLDPIWVRAYVDEPDLGKLRLGMDAAVSTDSFPGKTYTAWIGYISPSAEFTPKSVQTVEVRTSLVYQVRVYVCNPQYELRLGMPATVTIALNQPLPEANGVAKERCKTSG